MTETPSFKPETGAQCREITEVAKMHRSSFEMVRQHVGEKKLSVNPKDYEHAETKLEPTDTIDIILGKVFKNKDNVPPYAADRIKFSFEVMKINDLQKLGADSWSVTDGKLNFTSGTAEKKVTVFSINLLPWKPLNDRQETLEEKDLEKYKLGDYNTGKNIPVEAQIIIGSVDATQFMDRERDEKFYKDKQAAAKLLLQFFEADKTVALKRLDPATYTMVAALEEILKELATRTYTTTSEFRTNFEKKYGEKVLGANGVYNLVLAFQRVLDRIGADKLLSNERIEIRLKMAGKANSEADRYSKALFTKDEIQDEPGKYCPTDKSATANPDKPMQYIDTATAIKPAPDKGDEPKYFTIETPKSGQ